MLTVVSLVLGLMALVAPVASGLVRGDNLSTAARMLNDQLSLARTEAINQRALIQLRIVTDRWEGQGDGVDHRYRRFSLWRYDESLPASAADRYVQISRWENLPVGVLFEPDGEPTATYAFEEFPGTYVLGEENSDSTRSGVRSGAATFDAAWIEFTPTGGLRTSGSLGSLYLLLTEGFLMDGQDVPQYTRDRQNWAKVEINPLTGRIQTTRR
jgi:hypothetical protein